MPKLTSNQLKNKSTVTGATVTEALNTLKNSVTTGSGTGDMSKLVYDTNDNGVVDVAEVANAVAWAAVTSKPATFTPAAHNHPISDVTSLQASLNAKQASLVSGTTIKTVNGNSLLGSGDLTISGGGGGSGDVVGPASAVDNSIAVFNGTTGKLIKDGGKTLPAGSLVGTSDTQTLSAKTLTSPVINGGTIDTFPIGYRNVPQVSQSTAYTLVLTDAGKHILHPSADTTARIYTIPANSSVAYDVGTALTFVNQNAAGVLTIAITTDTMRLAGAGTTGSRTLAANGMATALKISPTEWLISGTGLT